MGVSAFDHIITGHEGEHEIPPDWAQGRSAFGGILVAMAVQDMTPLAEGRELRSVQALFSGPAAPGNVRVRCERVRVGKAATHLRAEVQSGEDRACLLHATFAQPRQTVLDMPGPTRPESPPPLECVEVPFVPGVTPTFTQHFGYRFASGGFPFTGAPGSSFAGWCRFKEESRAGMAQQVVALVDTWPAPILQRLTAPAPASSVTWQVDLAPLSAVDSRGWWFFQSESIHAAHGVAFIRSTLWAPDGAFAASSVQSVAVFA